MKHVLTITAAAAILTAGGGAAAWATVDDPPAASTIVDVSGDRDHGWTIEHYDGTVSYPPTFSEAKAECNEYHREANRKRCAGQLHTRNHFLWEMKRSLNWARSR